MGGGCIYVNKKEVIDLRGIGWEGLKWEKGGWENEVIFFYLKYNSDF